MSLLLAEEIADKSIAYIRDSQAAKLSNVQARSWAVSLELSTFQAIRLQDPDAATEADFPVLYCAPDSSDEENIGKGGSSAAWSHRFEWVVFAHHAGLGTDALSRPGNNKIPPAEAVKRSAMRYVLAVYEMLKDMKGGGASYHVAGDTVKWGTGPIRPQFVHGLTYTTADGESYADARLVIGVEHREVRT